MQLPQPENQPQHQGHRLRAGRCSFAGQIYLVTSVTRNREPHFTSLVNARAFVSSIKEAQQSTRTLAYVVMPDHFHWLVALEHGSDLSRVVQFVKSGTTRRLNKLEPGMGTIWQRGFHDTALRAEADIRGCARYIVANPLRAGLVSQIGDYPFWDAVWL